MLKLKLQYFGHLRRADSLKKSDADEKSGWQRMKWLDSITNSMDMSLSKLQDIVKDWEAWHTAIHGLSKSPTGLSK